MLKKLIQATLLQLLFSFSGFIFPDDDIEEVVITGSYIGDEGANLTPTEIIQKEDYLNLNITNIAEISKYLSSASGSNFQANTLGGIDQGMSSITLRGLDQASTLLLLNSKRHTYAGTPSNDGEGYIDAHIIPEIAFERIEILKEGATSLYGSDAVAGVVNFITYKKFDGYKLRFGDQTTTNYNQKDQNIGFLFGETLGNWDLVLGANLLNRSPLSAAEIDGIAELAISGLGNTFIVTSADEIEDGLYSGSYEEGQIVPDPNCVENGGILSGFCRFLYGNRFNIVNEEDHSKFYISASNEIHNISLITSNIRVIDNPQSPSYPALPYLSRLIEPGEGSSPFNVPVRWYGRPLGSQYPSPFSPKDISQYHFNYTFFTTVDNYDFELSLTTSEHKNFHNRPDVIDSRFQDAMQGRGGVNGNERWNIFEPNLNSESLVNYVRGAEKSEKIGNLTSLDLIGSSQFNSNFSFVFGAQVANEALKITYNDLARTEFDASGKLLRVADLFFLGGGQNVDANRNKSALFIETKTELQNLVDLQVSGRYENFKNDSSFNPKIALTTLFSDSFVIRFSRGTSFSMPSMAQMFSNEINLGSVRDFDASIFVRQAQIGNPNLQPSTATNQNYGFIWKVENQAISLDFWNINYKGRIIAESAQAKLINDPYGSSITRNELGDLVGVTTTYINEEVTDVSGLDFSYEKVFQLGDYGQMDFAVKATQISEFLTPSLQEGGESRKLINRVGRYNFDSNIHSLPKKRINSFLDWKYQDYKFRLIARFIDSYKNNRAIPESALNIGYRSKIDSSLMFDLSIKRSFGNYFENLDLIGSLAFINLLDEKPPLLYDAPDFSFDTRVHDPRGRMINIQFELSPKK